MKTCTAGDLAEFLPAKIEGAPGAKISGLASPESAGPEDLIYVDSPKYLGSGGSSAAKCVLAPGGLALPGKTVLRVAKPKLAFARAAAWLMIPERIATEVHRTAIIAPSARLAANVTVGPYAVIEEEVEIGENSEIGAFCFLGRGARLGEGCRLYPRVTLYGGARLAKGVVLHSGVVIGGDGFGYVYGEGRNWKFPQIGEVEIGDDVEIGCNTTIDRGSLGVTKIESAVKIDNLVQVGHNVRIGENTVVAAQTGISGSSTIGRRVVIGGQVGIADHCTIRDEAILGAQAGIPSGKIIQGGQTVWGTPARPLQRFKEQFAWFSRLPELGERIRKLERTRVDG